jgi:hypothetical protein
VKTPLEVRTPVATGDARKVGARTWRKQVLPFGKIKVGDRAIEFTPDYCRQVAEAFTDQAYDTVPIMLADKTNDHTMALLDDGGEVLGLDVADDGLYATVKLSNDAEQPIDRNRRCGVSVRIRENYERADGKFYPAAMQHLLLTWDPRVPGMKPWQPMDLSNSTGDGVVVVDLSTYTYGDADGAPGSTPTSEGAPTMGLTDDELTELRKTQDRLAELLGRAGDGPADADADADRVLTEDEEFQRIADEVFGPLGDDDTDTDADLEGEGDDDLEGQGEFTDPAGDDADVDERDLVSASNGGADGDLLDLANSGRSADAQRILDLSNALDESNYRQERDALVRSTGLPPSILDLAEPLLKGSRNVVELSNGSGTVDAGAIMRDVLKAIGDKVKLLDLSAALGTDEPATTEQQEALTRRERNVDAILANFN